MWYADIMTIFVNSFTALHFSEYPPENIKDCYNTTFTPRSQQSFSSISAVAVSATVVIVMLAAISGIMLYFCFKKRKVKDGDMTRSGGYDYQTSF